MRERLGVLGPTYRLLGQGMNDCDIAVKLHLNEVTVQNCVGWMLHSLQVSNRAELVLQAFNAAQPSSPVASLRVTYRARRFEEQGDAL